MKFVSSLWTASATLLGAALAADEFDLASYTPRDIIRRDVAVIGGGSTGTYAAIRLRDMDQSVVVVEKSGKMGGHTNTYTDPETDTVINFGVQTYSNYSVVRDFFERFQIPTSRYGSGASVYADFDTGELLPSFLPNFDFSAYAAQLAKYKYLITTWTLPDPVPEDLLMPFGDFLRKYDLGDIAFTIWSLSWGCGDVLSQPTVYMLKAIDEPFLMGMTQGTLTTANNGELYQLAGEELGEDVLLNSVVVGVRRIKRRNGKVRLVVRDGRGRRKIIIADKVLVSAPPNMNTMGSWDLDKLEKSTFSQFTNSALYVFLVTDTGLPTAYGFQNALRDSGDTFGIPPMPSAYNVVPTDVEGIFRVWYGGPHAVSEAEAKADIVAMIRRLRDSVNGEENSSDLEPRFLAYASHTPFQLAVDSESIANGFYNDLESLQGHRDTWYTGAAMLSHHAGQLWNFTEALLPTMIAA